MVITKEVSIGDWVNILDYHWDGSSLAVQVEGITKKYGTYYLQFGDVLSAEIERCEPIQITHEILERNGFKKGDDEDLLAWYGGLERVIWEDGGYTLITSVKTDRCYEGYCNNVHELQHALRLCGIIKEIEL